MGCGSSNEGGNSGGGAAAEDGAFEMFSASSLGCGNIKQSKGPASDGGDKFSKDFPTNGDTKGMAMAWGVSMASPVMMRYTIGGSSLDDMKDGLDGADITVPGGKCFHLALTSFFPWGAPCAKTKATMKNKYKGTMVFSPKVTTVDIFISVDGKAQEDGLLLKANASMTNAAIEQGVPEGAFCTVVSEHFSYRDEHGMHLPLLVRNGDEAELLRSSTDMGNLLASAFGTMAARVGAGAHDYSIRVAPRGHFDPEDDPNWWGFSNCSFKDADEACKEFVQTQLKGKVFPSFAHPGFKANFKLTVSEEVLAKAAAAAEKAAPEALSKSDVSAYDAITTAAKSAASGAPADKAGAALGQAVGPPDHILLATSNDYGADVGVSKSSEQRGGTHKTVTAFVYVWALWLSPSGPEDGEADGVMAQYRMEKVTTDHFAEVADPTWKNARTYMAQVIKNKSITAAIERDA